MPGNNPLSGWRNRLDEFLKFMATVAELTDSSFRMDPIATMTTNDNSADVTHNVGHRAGKTERVLDINVIHWLTWRDGKVSWYGDCLQLSSGARGGGANYFRLKAGRSHTCGQFTTRPHLRLSVTPRTPRPPHRLGSDS